MGGELQGQFTESEILINIDSENPAASSLRATVLTASGKTGSPQVDDSLPGAAWFDSTQFPESTFTSTAFDPLAASSWMVTGILNIRDVEREIEFPMDIDQQNSTASGGFTINRLDFDIGASEQPSDSQAGFNVIIDFTVNQKAAADRVRYV